MDRIDELFDALSKHNDYPIIRYKYLNTVTRIIYLCLKFRYCYQINMTQELSWIDEVDNLVIYYSWGYFGDAEHEDMDFFYEGEALKKIFDDVVKLMTYQGYHDIPEDLYKIFTKDKICTSNEKDHRDNFLKNFWFRKYAKKRATEYLNGNFYYPQ